MLLLLTIKMDDSMCTCKSVKKSVSKTGQNLWTKCVNRTITMIEKFLNVDLHQYDFW